MKLSIVNASALLVSMFILPSANATTIFLDADTVNTGSTLDTTPLVTTLGTIAFSGEVRGTADNDLIAAGSTGNVFDVVGSPSEALFSFDFDVDTISFLFGGNGGVFDLTAFDINNNVVDSFFASTGNGDSAGPATVGFSGAGIRSIFWTDPGFSFSAMDNITITGGTSTSAVPAPSIVALMAAGLAGLSFPRSKRKRLA